MILMSLFAPAFACGGFVPQSGAVATSDAQKAVYDLGENVVSVTYEARYQGNAADFAWVLAVPGSIASVTEGDAELIPALEEVAAPQIEVDPAVYDSEDVGCGCGGMAGGSKNDSLGTRGDTGVQVTGSGYAGDYSYTTLAASDADSLATWLTDHGYDIALIEASLTSYVEDPVGYEFVAVQLRPEVADTQGESVNLDPLQIDYGPAADGNLHVSFPAKLGVSSSVETVRTEIYVLGTGKAELSGWSAVTNGAGTEDEPWDIVGPDYEIPEEMYTAKLLEIGMSQPRMWLAFSGAAAVDGTERWVTRYDAIVAPTTNTVDPVFTDSGEPEEAVTIIYLQEESAYEAAQAALLVPAAFLAFAGWRRRRKG